MIFTHGMKIKALVLVMLTGVPGLTLAFDSGSTGADGAFAPTVNTQLQLPPDGIFNFTDVTIPAGVSVTFAKNATNTPVTILASGDVTVAGTIDVNGGSAAHVGAAGDGNLGDDGVPGRGGSGGFDGGSGGQITDPRRGGNGLGPGGGGGAPASGSLGCGGGGGGYGSVGGNPPWCSPNLSGSSYGTPSLLPLIGGSGGGGGGGGTNFRGGGGGGGGGAILIAVSGTVNVTGSILANGGSSGSTAGENRGGSGGGGSGGAIRIIATTISGTGPIEAKAGGVGNDGGCCTPRSLAGANGRIRLEAENMQRTAGTNPAFTFSGPQDVFVAGMPTLRIIRVAGVDAPVAPSGNADITLPADTVNPVAVEFATTGVPVGNTVSLTVTPANGAGPTTVISNALAGTEDNAATAVNATLPTGPSVLSATVSYTVTAAIGDEMSRFAEGERVERIVLAAGSAGSETQFITVSGKTYTYPSLMPRFN